MPTVTVRHFAALREARGCDTEQVVISEGTTCRELYRQLFPGPLEKMRVGFARNHTFTQHDVVLEDGDEVAFLPPLGGG